MTARVPPQAAATKPRCPILRLSAAHRTVYGALPPPGRAHESCVMLAKSLAARSDEASTARTSLGSALDTMDLAGWRPDATYERDAYRLRPDKRRRHISGAPLTCELTLPGGDGRLEDQTNQDSVLNRIRSTDNNIYGITIRRLTAYCRFAYLACETQNAECRTWRVRCQSCSVVCKMHRKQCRTSKVECRP